MDRPKGIRTMPPFREGHNQYRPLGGEYVFLTYRG